MKKMFIGLKSILSLLIIFSLGGCYLPLVKKEVTLPFIEKKPEEVLSLAMQNFKNNQFVEFDALYEMELDIKNNGFSLFNTETGNKIAKFVNENSPQVLGIDNQESVTESPKTLAPEVSNKVKIECALKGKSEIDNKQLKRGAYNVNMKYAMEGVIYEINFDFIIDEKIYYVKINIVPELVRQVLVEMEIDIKDKWFKLESSDGEIMQKELGIVTNDVDTKAVEDLNIKFAEKVKEYKVLNLKERKRDELINEVKNYHYLYDINKESLEKVIFEFINMYEEELSKSVLAENEIFDTEQEVIKKFIEAIKENSIDIYIDKKSLQLSKIVLAGTYDLTDASSDKEAGPEGLINFKASINYKNIGVPIQIDIPQNAFPFIEIINKELEKSKARAKNAKIYSDVRILSTSIELYALEHDDLYPEDLSKLEDPSVMTKPEYVSGSICPEDSVYEYTVNEERTEYEIKFCLDRGGMGFMAEGENKIVTGGGLAEAIIDSDGDGLSDRDEMFKYFSDSDNPDTDGDGFKDGEEVKNGYSPVGAGVLLEYQ